METRLPFAGHLKATLALGLPLIGSHLAQIALNVANTVMLGWYGVAELAAAVLATSCYIVIFLMGSGFAWAVMPLVAAAAGQPGGEPTVRRATRMGLWLSLFYAAVFLPLLWWSEPVFLLLGQKEETARLAQTYLRIAGLGLVPALVIMVLKSTLAALERTQVVLWVTLAALGVNIGLNWLLIFGNAGAPEMGLSGAATASLIVQILSCVVLAIYAARLPALRHFEIFRRFWRPEWAVMGRVFRLGWPIGLTSLAESGLFTATAIMMGWIGTRELAAHGIAMELASMMFMLHMGLSNAATVRTGRYFGQDEMGELRRGALAALVLSGGFAVVAILLYLVFPEPLISAFLGRDEPERAAIIAIGTSLLVAAALFQFADAAQVMALGLLRGVQDTRVPMVIAAVCYWLVGMPAAWLLGFHTPLGAQGVWFGLVIGLAPAGTLMMVRFWRGQTRRETALRAAQSSASSPVA